MIEELKKVIKGEVKDDEATLQHYSADGSIFEVKPKAVVLPQGQEDLIELVKFVSQQRKMGNEISLTARGKGTDLTGGPLSEGIIVRFSGYMDKILEIGEDYVRVEPGMIYGELQKELAKKGHWIPVNPASGAFCSVGGMVANNSGGTRALKYGNTRKYVKSLKVILSDGSEIDTSKDRIPQADQLRLILEQHRDLIQAYTPHVTKNSSGYALADFLATNDITQLFIGSQGTLGLIQGITFHTIAKPGEEGVLLGYFDSLSKAGEAVQRLLPLKPSALEMVDKHIIDLIKTLEPELAQDISERTPEIILFCEFDGANEEEVLAQFAPARRIMQELAFQVGEAIKPPQEDRLWKLRNESAKIVTHMKGNVRAVPLEFDCTVPVNSLLQYIEMTDKIFKDFGFEYASWGHIGDANFHIRPILNFEIQEERAKLANLVIAMYEMVGQLRGSATGEHNDGIMSTPFLYLTYGQDMVDLFREAKKIFDPLDIFNPFKKVGMTVDHFNRFLRKDFKNYYSF